jgi:hypothetical protein
MGALDKMTIYLKTNSERHTNKDQRTTLKISTGG